MAIPGRTAESVLPLTNGNVAGLIMNLKKSSRARLKKEPLMLYAEPEQADALKELSARTRIPQQAFLREGLDYVLEKHGAKKKGAAK
jgi:hypothetical protein